MRTKSLLRASSGNPSERNKRRPADEGVPHVVDAAPPRPPGQLGELSRGEQLVCLSGELGQLLDHHRSGRKVHTECKGLGCVDDLQQAGCKQFLHQLLEEGQHARMVAGDSPPEAGLPLFHTQCLEVLNGDGSESPGEKGVDLV